MLQEVSNDELLDELARRGLSTSDGSDQRTPVVTYDELRELLDYNPATGVFMWKRTRGSSRYGALAWQAAGCVNSNGYVVIKIKGRTYGAHRLAWLCMTGAFPRQAIDHIDNDRANNRWGNLREASSRQNALNKRHTPNKLGFKGVSYSSVHAARGWKPYAARVKLRDGSSAVIMAWTAEEAHNNYIMLADIVYGERAYKH